MGLCNCKKPCSSTDYDVNYNSADNGFDLPVFDLIFSRDYSAFKNCGQTAEIWSFLSEIFGQKIDFSKLAFQLVLWGNFEKSYFWPKVSPQKPQK